MARTRLFTQLQQMIKRQALARRYGVSVAELRELRERKPEDGAGVDSKRRRLLGAAGAVAAATLMPAPVRPVFARQQPTIAIVGGGIAGLNCALELADRGIAATLYEAGRRISGRMFSSRDLWNDGQVSEWGGEFIDSGHVTMRRLARRFELALDDLHAAAPAGSTDTFFFDGVYYTQAEADRDFSLIYDRVQEDLTAAPFPTTFDAFTPAAQALDHMSVYDWIESRIPGGHVTQLGQLLDTAYAIEYAADTTDQSALNILYLLGFQPDESGRTLSLFGESDERFHIRGGNDRLPSAIARHLGSGAIQLDRELRRIKRTSGGSYALTFESRGKVDDIRADLVVLALPFAVLRELDYEQAGFDDLKRRVIQRLGRGISGKLHLQFESRLWNQPGPWGVSTGSSDSDTGYQESWDVTRAQPGDSGILSFYSGGSVARAMRTRTAFATASNPLVVQDARRALQQAQPVFPGLKDKWNGRATQSLWHFNRFAKLSYSYYRVGQYTEFGGYEKVRQGGVLFCGEHTSTDFQGFMEGAAEQGARAARQAARILERRHADA
jgi:monoamine oxidase